MATRMWPSAWKAPISRELCRVRPPFPIPTAASSAAHPNVQSRGIMRFPDAGAMPAFKPNLTYEKQNTLNLTLYDRCDLRRGFVTRLQRAGAESTIVSDSEKERLGYGRNRAG